MKQLLPCIALFLSMVAYAQPKDPELWYRQPASKWTQALPVGNGRLGGMVFGGYDHERIQLNEESVWAGSKMDNNNPQAKSHLEEIRQLIFSGDYAKALHLSGKYLLGTPLQVRSYQPLGNLLIHYQWKHQPTAYRRSLDIASGIAKTVFTVDGNTITEEVFSSAPQDAMVISITAEKKFNAGILLSREYDSASDNEGRQIPSRPTKEFYRNKYKNAAGLAYYTGQIIDTVVVNKGPEGNHMRYATAIKILSVDGAAVPVQTDTSVGFNLASVKKIVLLLTGATDYNIDQLDVDKTIDPLYICKGIINKAAAYTAIDLKRLHVKDHRSMFERIAFSLGADDNSALATDERLARMREGKTDNGLVTLYYQFGRYLLMGSSRKPGRLPANLQGIWSYQYDAPWNSDFHTNINLQMNYWPAESGNLSETSLPLAGFVNRLTVPGAVTAREMYGAKGWTLHHLTDVYGTTGVMDGAWGITSMDGPWMTFPLYDHFEFTQDTAFLQNVVYPVMKGSVEFVLDFLVKSPEGYLVTNPSHSPENSFYVPGTNKKESTAMTYAPTVDSHIINALFNNFTKAANIFHTDTALLAKLKAAQKLLPPMKVAANGTLQEWIKDYEEVDPGHRHISHLLGLYPLNLITPNDKTFFDAAKKTLERRLANGGGHTGWSRAWIICLYARLLQPEKAMDNLNDLLRKSTLDNLFDTHPPFQIDGNFGGAAAIAEMLLQSQNNAFDLLPALPAQWPEGYMHGIRARGACTLNIDWSNGALTKVVVKSDKGGNFTVRYKDKIKKLQLGPGKSITLDGSLNGSL